MKKLPSVGAVACGALSSVTPQLLALLILTPAAYGTFAIAYVFFGLALASSFSLVCDPWLRSRGASPLSLVEVQSSSFGIALVVGAGVGLLAFVLVSIPVGLCVATSLASFGGFLRSTGRFVLMAEGSSSLRVYLPDLISAIAVAGTLGLMSRLGPIEIAMWTSWAVGQVLAGLTSMPAGVGAFVRRSAGWISMQKERIRVLWAESLILDLSVAFGSVLLSYTMAIAEFAVVRAAGSATLPIRLVLNPMRPILSTMPAARVLEIRVLVISWVGAAFAGALVGVLVWLSALVGALQHSVLFPLADFGVAVAVICGCQALGFIYYVVARGSARLRQVKRARLVDSGLIVALPVLGAVYAGLSGAMWATAASSLASVGIWLYVVCANR